MPLDLIQADNPAATDFLRSMQRATKEAQEQIRKSHISMANHVNQKRSPSTYKEGDRVWLSTKNLALEEGSGSRKLNPKYCGPFRITKCINNVIYHLDLSQPMIDRGIHNAFHASLLKPYHEDDFNRQLPPPPPLQFQDGHAEYEVEKILNHRRRRNRIQYLVKWQGYGDHENSRQSDADLASCQDLLAAYKSRVDFSS